MKKLVLNLSAFAVVSTGSLYLASPAAAVATGGSEGEVTCSDGSIVITISNGRCEMVDGRCHCWQE